MYERFTDRARKVMQLANQEAQRFNHEYIGTEHMLLGIIKEGSGVAANVLQNLGMDLGKVRSEVEKIVQTGPGGDQVVLGKLPPTPRAKKVIEYSIEEARGLNHNYVGTEHLLLGLLREQDGVAAQVLMNLGMKLEGVREEILNLLGHNLPDDDQPRVKVISPRAKTPTLDTLANDLNEFARKDNLDPLIGRQTELTALFEVLACRSRKNAVLLGEPGVGRSALVAGLVHAIVDGRAPEWLRNRRVVLLPISRLWADGNGGRFGSDRTRAVFNEVRRARDTVLFLPDAIASLGIAAGGPTAERVHVQLLAALWTEQVPCIFTATSAEYQRCLQRRPALEASVQTIILRPATVAEAAEVLRGLRDRHGAHHRVTITDDALTAAAEAADRLPGVLPGKAVVLLDRACARCRTLVGQSPSGAAIWDLDVQIEELNRQKEDAVSDQDFPRGAELRDRADALRKEKERLLAERREAVVDAVLVAEVARDLAGDGPPPAP